MKVEMDILVVSQQQVSKDECDQPAFLKNNN